MSDQTRCYVVSVEAATEFYCQIAGRRCTATHKPIAATSCGVDPCEKCMLPPMPTGMIPPATTPSFGHTPTALEKRLGDMCERLASDLASTRQQLEQAQRERDGYKQALSIAVACGQHDKNEDALAYQLAKARADKAEQARDTLQAHVARLVGALREVANLCTSPDGDCKTCVSEYACTSIGAKRALSLTPADSAEQWRKMREAIDANCKACAGAGDCEMCPLGKVR